MNFVKNCSSYKRGKIKNIALYFLKALKDDFKEAKAISGIQYSVVRGEINIKHDEMVDGHKRSIKRLDYAWDKYLPLEIQICLSCIYPSKIHYP